MSAILNLLGKFPKIQPNVVGCLDTNRLGHLPYLKKILELNEDVDHLASWKNLDEKDEDFKGWSTRLK